MKVTLNRVNQAVHFEMKNERGNIVHADGSAAIGGEGKGASPKELVLMGAAGCSSVDVVLILKKMRQQLDDIKVETEGEWVAEGDFSILRKLHMHFKLYGTIKEEKAKQAVQMSIEKYCSVSKTLEFAAEVTWSMELNPTV